MASSTKLNWPSTSKGGRTSLRRYESCLGHGSFGIVIKVVDGSTGSSAAVKFVFPETDDEFKQIFRECIISENLAPHDNVLRVVQVEQKKYELSNLENIMPDSILDDTQLELKDKCKRRLRQRSEITGVSLEMELCGENLRKWISEQGKSSNEYLHHHQFVIIKNIVAGLAYLHLNNILHRDLKPENVMFSNSGFQFPVKIGDFGLCRNLQDMQSNTLTSRTGTFDYMAPECFRKDYSYPADLYSLGLVIWEVAQLLECNGKKSLFDRLVNDKEVNLVSLPVEINYFRDLIISLTRRKIVERPESIEVVEQLIDAVQFRGKQVDCRIPQAIVNNPTMVVRNEDELRKCLRYSTSNSRIMLSSGTYIGEFAVQGDHLSILGQGATTVFRGCIVVTGNSNKLAYVGINSVGFEIGLQILGDMNSVRSVNIFDGNCALSISGCNNKFVNSQISESDVEIDGNDNLLNEIKVDGRLPRSITISSSSNTISNVIIDGEEFEIRSDGNNNKLSNISFCPTNGTNSFLILSLSELAEYNNIDNFNCPITSYNSRLIVESDHSMVVNSVCRRVLISGNNVTFNNVHCVDDIKVDTNSNGVKLIECKGQLLRANSNVQIIDSKFKEIKNPSN